MSWAVGNTYSTGFKLIEKINATALQSQRNVLKYFAIFKNVAHSLKPGECRVTRRLTRLQTKYNVLKYSK